MKQETSNHTTIAVLCEDVSTFFFFVMYRRRNEAEVPGGHVEPEALSFGTRRSFIQASEKHTTLKASVAYFSYFYFTPTAVSTRGQVRREKIRS